MRTCVPMVVCVLLPRLELLVAAGERRELLARPSALAPAPGGVQAVGEVSLAAEAFGIHPGMRLGEALARCPQLTLIPPDPAGVADRWERVLVRLESIGAAVEPERPGLVCFDARGLLRLHGGIEGILAATRRALRTPARLGVAPSRFAAVAAAIRARPRRPVIIAGGRAAARAFLAPMPVALLRARPSLAALPEALERLGVSTLGELAALPPAAVADRFGTTGLLAHELACGGDGTLHPRPPGELIRESLELPEAGSGVQLERALGLLIDRLLARRERRGRTLRAVVLSAVLGGSGSCSARRWPTRCACAWRWSRACSCSRHRRRSCGWPWSGSGRRPATSGRCSASPRRRGGSACARRSARPEVPPGRTPPSACCPSIPAPECPSGGWC